MDNILQTRIQWLPEQTYSVTYPFVRIAQVFWLAGAPHTALGLLYLPEQVVAASGIWSLVASTFFYLLLSCLVAALACTLNRAIGAVLALWFIAGAILVATAPFKSSNPFRFPFPDNQSTLMAFGFLFVFACNLYLAQLGIRAGVMWAFCRSSTQKMISELHGTPLVSLNALSKVLGLRIDSGRPRRSSPSLTRMSKA
jgi:hypothetical protein